MKNNPEKQEDVQTKWFWNIWSIWKVDQDSKLAVEMALFLKNPELLTDKAWHLLIHDKKWNIN